LRRLLLLEAVSFFPLLLGRRRAADLVVFQDTRRTVELEGGGLLAGCGAAQRKKKAAKGDLFPDRFLKCHEKQLAKKSAQGRSRCASLAAACAQASFGDQRTLAILW